MKKEVVIIGGGISGLSSAFFLKKHGSDFLLVEKSDRLGGVMHSLTKEDYLLEEGPTTFMGMTPSVKEMIATLHLESQILTPEESSKKRYIYKNGKLHLVPLNPLHLFSSSLLSWKGKLRLFREPLVSRRQDVGDETVAQFFKRRIGKEATESLIDPFVSGVYGSDMRELSVQATFPQLAEWEKEFGSLFKGFLKKKEKKDRTLYSFKNGLEELPLAIEKWLGNHVLKKSQVTHIEKNEQGHFILTIFKEGHTQTIETKTLICAAPSYGAAEMLQSLDPELATELLQIPYAGLNVYHLGYRKEDVGMPCEGFGFLIPRSEQTRSENKKTLGVLWTSSFFQNRAPENHLLLTVMAKGEANLEDVLEEVRGILSTQGKPQLVHEKKYLKALPQYTLGHLERVIRIEQHLKQHPGLFISGNFLRGVSTLECIEQGFETVVHLLKLPHAQASQKAI
ncbi:MAG: protoporphyrinogen oxidase [Deltaproteobacteria bacterium]|nr:protoporphyrinogen oxidase [Deltaproteobacteria bacterium]